MNLYSADAMNLNRHSHTEKRSLSNPQTENRCWLYHFICQGDLSWNISRALLRHRFANLLVALEIERMSRNIFVPLLRNVYDAANNRTMIKALIISIFNRVDIKREFYNSVLMTFLHSRLDSRFEY